MGHTYDREQFKMMYDYIWGKSSKEGHHWGPGTEGSFLGGDSAGKLHFEGGWGRKQRSRWATTEAKEWYLGSSGMGQNKYYPADKVEPDWELEDAESGLGKNVNCLEMR